jgi:hypothetical protein
VSLQIVDIGGTLENLDDSALARNFKDLTLSQLTVTKTDIDDLGVFGELDIFENDEGTLDIEDGTVVDTGSNVVITGRGTGVDLGN